MRMKITKSVDGISKILKSCGTYIQHIFEIRIFIVTCTLTEIHIRLHIVNVDLKCQMTPRIAPYYIHSLIVCIAIQMIKSYWAWQNTRVCSSYKAVVSFTMYTYTHTLTHAHSRTCIYIYIFIYIYIYIFIYIFIYLYIYIYIIWWGLWFDDFCDSPNLKIVININHIRYSDKSFCQH